MTYASDRLHEEIAYVAYHFHWPLGEILDLEHPTRQRFVSEIAAAAMRELCTPAQLDVFRRVQALLRAEPPVGHRDERA